MTDETDHRQEAVDLMDAAWRGAHATNGQDSVTPIQLALAQTAALLYVGDEINKLAYLMNNGSAVA